MKKYSKFLAIMLVFAMILPGIAQAAPVAGSTQVERVAGAGREETAIAASKVAYPAGATNVVLAGYAGEVDALTGTLLANEMKAPLLLTRAYKLTDATKAEITRLGAKKVYILGGEKVVEPKVVTELEAMNITVERIDGDNRYETAVMAGEKSGAQTKKVFLAKGLGILADALAVGPASAKEDMPVLLTQTDMVPEATMKALKDWGVTHITLVGGTSAISAKVETQLKAMNITVNRVEGSDREKTAVAIADKYFAGSKNVIVANGYVYADALVGGYLGALQNAPIVLVDTNVLKASTEAHLKKADMAWILGGVNAVNDATALKVVAAVDDTAMELKVVSVSAINGVTVEVEFGVALDDTDLASKVSVVGVTFNAPTLSKDGKTITLTSNTAINVENATVVVEPIKIKADDKVKTEKYVGLMTYKDELAPKIVSVEAKTNGTVATGITVKASEPVKTGSLAKINGSYATIDFNGTDTATVSGLSLETGKTHTLELINFEDIAGNKTVTETVSFTVAVDTVAPVATVTAGGSDKEIKVTFNKSMNDASVKAALVDGIVKDEALGDITSATAEAVSNTDNKEYTIAISETNIFANKDSREFSVVLPKDIEDKLGNKTSASVQKVVLNKDKVKPVATGYNVIKDNDGKVEKIEISFSEGLKADATTATLAATASSIVDSNGILVTSPFDGYTSAAIVAGDKKLVFTGTATKIEGKFAFSFPKDLVTDQSETGNKSAAFNYTIDFGDGKTETELKLDAQGATNTAPVIGTSNVIKVTYPEKVKGGAVAGSATDIANYTLAGKPLPAGTTITLDAATQKVATITLPADSIEKDDVAAVFTISNVKNIDGTKTVKSYVATVDVKDNIAPTLVSARILDNLTIELTYNEAIDTLSATDVATAFEIKNGASTAFVHGGLVANNVPGFDKKVKLTLTTALDLTKEITVETLEAVIKDASSDKNVQKAEVKVTVSK